MTRTTPSFVHTFARILSIFFVVLTFGIVILTFFQPDLVKSVIAWIGNLIEHIGVWNYLIAFLSACIESLPIIGVVLPGMNIMILVGGFWGKTHLIGTLLSASVGAMLGNFLGFWLGREYGREILDEHGEWFGLGKTEVKIMDRQIAKNGPWYIILGKFHNVARAFVPFLAGSGGMQLRTFWLYNTIGSVIWAITVNCLGIFFIDQYEMILDNFGKILLVIMIGFLGYAYFFQREKWNSYLREKRQEIEEKEQKRAEKRKNSQPNSRT